MFLTRDYLCHPSEEKATYHTLKGFVFLFIVFFLLFEWITPATRSECIVDVTDQGVQRKETEEHRNAVSVSLGTPLLEESIGQNKCIQIFSHVSQLR